MSKRGLIEAALFVSGSNLSAEKLAKVIGSLDVKAVKEEADRLVEEYKSRDGGVEVFKTGKSYGMRVKPEYEDSVTMLIPETDMPKAMLKTLAMIAYEQPIKQSYLVKLRGNRVYEYMKRLEALEFIDRKPEGHTKMITTTAKFNKYFRINDAKELVKREVGAEEDADSENIVSEDGPSE
ncbi:MAG: SMC-Scp complex subunit ScpB [Candidatus Altiarchaeales archaeon]|nr:SMC-Scp complex subunit ScpB [Candidatus Altiarchaeales archaeon]MBD3417305.1 SMC-Scp complex subunit ScpB [Candidatus Altiarchaeales archaeon]